MLTFVLDQLKTKNMCKNAVKKLPSMIWYVPDQYKTQEMCEKVILEHCEMLMFLPNCYKNKKMCNKTVDNCTCIRICPRLLQGPKNV